MILDGGARVKVRFSKITNTSTNFTLQSPQKVGAGSTPSSLPNSAPAYIDILGSERGASGIRNDG